MEKEKIICGYHTLIDWDKANLRYLEALRAAAAAVG